MQYLYWRGDNFISAGVLHLASLPPSFVPRASHNNLPSRQTQGCYVWTEKKNTNSEL